MSSTEEGKEQVDVTMEESEKPMPPSQEEVVFITMYLFITYFYISATVLLNICLVQEAAIKKKYGGIMPKKPPLISKVLLYLLIHH